jgi:hypothetical protein
MGEKAKPPAELVRASQTFAGRVHKLYRQTRPTAYEQGFRCGQESVTDIVEETALRAALSPGSAAADVEAVLRCILAKVHRDVDKASDLS